jgi:hypothetical protein
VHMGGKDIRFQYRKRELWLNKFEQEVKGLETNNCVCVSFHLTNRQTSHKQMNTLHIIYYGTVVII